MCSIQGTTKSWCRWKMSSHPGDLPPLLGALLSQQLAPCLSSQTKRARSCSYKIVPEQESAETRQKNALMLRPLANNHDSESCPLYVLAVFSLGSLKISFSDETPLARQLERQNCLRIRIALSLSPSRSTRSRWILATPSCLVGDQLMNPRRCRPHRSSLCLPQSSARQLLAILSHQISS